MIVPDSNLINIIKYQKKILLTNRQNLALVIHNIDF